MTRRVDPPRRGARTLGAALTVLAVLGVGPVRASAAESPRALRTLAYDVDVTVADVRDTPGAGIRGTRPVVAVKRRVMGAGSETRGSGSSEVGVSLAARGTITVAVLSATDDGGLVLDVTENAERRTRPTMRFVVGGDGQIVYDPQKASSVTEEQLALVRWLARGFYGERPTDPGTAWTVDQSANGQVDLERYRVVARAPHRVTLAYEFEEKAAGSAGFSGTRRGSLVYDTAMVLPVKAAFAGEAHRQTGATYDTLRTSVTLTLTGDSFAGKAG